MLANVELQTIVMWTAKTKIWWNNSKSEKICANYAKQGLTYLTKLLELDILIWNSCNWQN